MLTAALIVVGGTSAYAAGLPTGPSATGLTGSRTSATRLSFPIDDRVSASVDVGTGNLNIAASLLALPGVHGKVPVGLAYNSRDTTAPLGPTSSLKGPGAAWTWNLAGAGSLSLAPNGTTIDYTTADGAVWPFTQSGTAYVAPAGLKAMLVKTGTTYTLMALGSRQVITFNANGDPTSVADKNGNPVTITPWASNVAKVATTAGATASQTATLTFAATTDSGYTTYGTTVSQQSSVSGSRSAFVEQTSAGLVLSVTDPAGGQTQFLYSGGLISKITNPLGATTSFTYDSSKRVTQVDRSNATTGSAGTSTTRFTYPSSTSTLVAGPNTDLGQSVASVPHATYTLDSNGLVTNAKDAANRERSTTYTTQGLDTATSTTGTAGGSPASVLTTYGYASGTNSGLSLTSEQAQGGNTSTASYGNTGASQYLPSSTATDTNVTSMSNTTRYGYNTAGNLTTTTADPTVNGQQGSSTAVTSTVTYNANGDGLVATATAPGNGSNATTYHYTNHQLDSVTPVTGSSLGTKSYTYDGYARLKTASDGAGRTTTYTYDSDDRVLTTSFSDSTGTVTNTWDAAGNLKKQVSDGGTITSSYDQLGQLISTENTSAGGPIAYGWDKAGNNTSITDTRGTTTQTFDDAGVLLSTTYPKGSGTASTWFKNDDNGNPIDVWLQSNATQSAWAAHTHTTYDSSGRASRIVAQKGPVSSPTTQMDVTYCYNSAGSGTSCGSASGTDYSKLQWTYNAVTSQTTKFTYDGMGRLTKVTESGGSDGNSTYQYTYDSRGNRLTANVTGSTTSSQTLTYNAANQITSSGYSYDGAGNMTASPGSTYTYNAAQQMTKAVVSGTTTTYTYAGAAQNNVLSESTSGGTTYKVVYGRGGGIAQYKVGGQTAHVEQNPVTGQATMLHTSSDIAALYVYDGLGSPVGLLTDFNTTSFQYKYDPYGLPTLQQTSGGNGVGQNPYAFKSGVQDRATGFVKFGARWYNPVTGTWTQQDTLDTPLDINNANRYSFAGDDPINGSDPGGTITVCGAVSAILAIVGGVATIAGLAALSVATAGTALALFGLIATAVGVSTALPGIVFAIEALTDVC